MNIASDSSLKGMRVLVVEDSALIAMHLEDILQEAGCEIVGPVGHIEEAMEIAKRDALDVAVLDINVHGEKVFGVAAELQRRGVPLVFSTGYGMRQTPAAFKDAPFLSKPFEPEALLSALADACRSCAGTIRPPSATSEH